MNRAPVARNPMKIMKEMASSVLKIPQSTELLMTSVPPKEGLSVKHIFGIFSGKIPLKNEFLSGWPDKMSHLQCLHCGGMCDVGPPVPAVRQYEIQLDRYWVYGPFCRPCCAFGSICEYDSTSKQLAPTAEILRKYFGLQKMIIAPPRASHWRFGGPLKDVEFYGDSGYVSLGILQPPFVTFANYVVGVHQQSAVSTVAVSALLPQSAGRLINLTRPEYRAEPLAEKKQTGRCPLILEFLAKQTEVVDRSEQIQVKESSKRRKVENNETKGFLRQYVVKK